MDVLHVDVGLLCVVTVTQQLIIDVEEGYGLRAE
jgi:hypothetical protein